MNEPTPGERSLQAQQEALLEALWAPSPQAATVTLQTHVESDRPGAASWVRGLRAYRSNAVELSVRVLAAAYPGLSRMLGDEDFRGLARTHWTQCPPRQGDLARWGSELPAHLAAILALVADAPWVCDMAHLEWALHEAHIASDVRPDLGSLALLAEADPASIALVCGDGLSIIESVFPVASVLQACLRGDGGRNPAGQGHPDDAGECAVVWRRGLQPEFRRAVEGEPAFLKKLKEPCSLADALNSAPGLELGPWLKMAVEDGLLLGARRYANPQGNPA